ncbi:hypothetical protein [Chroococcidiopsis cubana]|uniref:hypothetical protein n=1 Tax=Chroococcidiopsis cubana TaxID=171392 RepID=UPI0018F5AE92|nr:hypothetical protein [Chroococcidiopsis cubana]
MSKAFVQNFTNFGLIPAFGDPVIYAGEARFYFAQLANKNGSSQLLVILWQDRDIYLQEINQVWNSFSIFYPIQHTFNSILGSSSVQLDTSA